MTGGARVVGAAKNAEPATPVFAAAGRHLNVGRIAGPVHASKQ